MFFTFYSTNNNNDRNLKKGAHTLAVIGIIFVPFSLVFAAETPLSKQEVAEIERNIVYTFKDQGVLTDVFRPSNLSLLRPTSFQELEFLGDKIINAFVAYSIFSRTEPVRTLEQKFTEKTQTSFFSDKFSTLKLPQFLKNNAPLEPFYSRSFKSLVGAMHLDAKQQGAAALEKFRQFMKTNLGLAPLAFVGASSSGFDYNRKREIETKLGYSFQEEGLLAEVFQRAQTTGYYGYTPESTAYEQLGFLGDKILGASVTDAIFSSKEDLSKLKEKFTAKTKTDYLSQQNQTLQLTDFLRDSLKRDPTLAFKALVAAILLDSSKDSDAYSYSKKRSPFFVVSPESAKFIATNLALNPSSTVTVSPAYTTYGHAAFTAADLSPADVKSIEDKIGYQFKNKQLLTNALYHSSLVQRPTEFEQLEFLGDRIINLVVAVSIFSGSETTRRLQAQLEAKTTNAYFAQKFEQMGLGRFLQRNPNSNNDKVFADAFEALVGAIYLDARGNIFLPVEALRFLSKTLELEASSIYILLPTITPPVVSIATVVTPSSRYHLQPALSVTRSRSDTLTTSPTEAEIQIIIGKHPKWAGLTEAQRRNRAKQSWGDSIKSRKQNC